jgi:hypothetical protein
VRKHRSVPFRGVSVLLKTTKARQSIPRVPSFTFPIRRRADVSPARAGPRSRRERVPQRPLEPITRRLSSDRAQGCPSACGVSDAPRSVACSCLVDARPRACSSISTPGGRRAWTPAIAWDREACPDRNAYPPAAFRLSSPTRAHPLARRRGGRPRWRDTPAESNCAGSRRRSCGREGVDARGPRRGRGRPAGQGRSSGGWRGTRPSDGACGV